MFGSWSHEVAQLSLSSSRSTKRFAKHMRNTSSTLTDNVSNTSKRASRRISLRKPKIPGPPPSCVEYILDRWEDLAHDTRPVTPVSYLRWVASLARISRRVNPGNDGGTLLPGTSRYLNYPVFLCGVRGGGGHSSSSSTSHVNPFPSIPSSVSSLPNGTYSNAHISRSLEVRTTTQVRGQEVLCIVQTLSTTASLPLHPQLDAAWSTLVAARV
jgi:hypothetical protein